MGDGGWDGMGWGMGWDGGWDDRLTVPNLMDLNRFLSRVVARGGTSPSVGRGMSRQGPRAMT